MMGVLVKLPSQFIHALKILIQGVAMKVGDFVRLKKPFRPEPDEGQEYSLEWLSNLCATILVRQVHPDQQISFFIFMMQKI